MRLEAHCSHRPSGTTSVRKGSILCFGRDAALLRTRVALLSGIAQVQGATDLTKMEKLAGQHRFDLIILCHTLSNTDCGLSFQLARQYWPEAQILALASASRGCAAANDHHHAFAEWLNPQAFVAQVSVLLSRKTDD